MRYIILLTILGLSSTSFGTSITILPEGEQKQATVKIDWEKDPIEVSVSGGKLLGPKSFTFTNGIFVGKTRITRNSSRDGLELAALVLYDTALSCTKQILIFKHMVQNKILPDNIRVKPDGITYCIDGKWNILATKHSLKIEFFMLSSKKLLGTAAIDNDSYEISWVPEEL